MDFTTRKKGGNRSGRILDEHSSLSLSFEKGKETRIASSRRKEENRGVDRGKEWKERGSEEARDASRTINSRRRDGGTSEVGAPRVEDLHARTISYTSLWLGSAINQRTALPQRPACTMPVILAHSASRGRNIPSAGQSRTSRSLREDSHENVVMRGWTILLLSRGGTFTGNRSGDDGRKNDFVPGNEQTGNVARKRREESRVDCGRTGGEFEEKV